MDDKVPVGLARLWRLPTESRLGRPAELDVEQVVRAAVELADRDGLAGVTLAKVAKELGYTTMSLYRHVGSKEELLVLMGDAATGPARTFPPAPRSGAPACASGRTASAPGTPDTPGCRTCRSAARRAGPTP